MPNCRYNLRVMWIPRYRQGQTLTVMVTWMLHYPLQLACCLHMPSKQAVLHGLQWRISHALTEDDKRAIIDGKMLQGQHINFAQRLINHQFPNINGLQLSVMQDKPFKGPTRNALQIIHVRKNHWIVAASHKVKVVHVHDSAFSSLDQTSAATVQNLFRCSLSNISIVLVQKKLGGSDCGLFAIANATAITFGRNPSKEVYQQSLMQSHVITCFEQQKMELFP